MPNQKESHAAGVSTYITPRFHRRGTPPCPDQSPNPKNAKRTQFPAPPASCPLFHAQKCETNPIYPCPSLAHDPNMRNEPNLGLAPHYSRFTAHYSLLLLNQPNLPPPSYTPPPFLRNEPNFTPPPRAYCLLPQICETNPISVETPKSTIYNRQYTIPSPARRKDQKAIDRQAASSYHARFAGRIRELFL